MKIIKLGKDRKQLENEENEKRKNIKIKIREKLKEMPLTCDKCESLLEIDIDDIIQYRSYKLISVACQNCDKNIYLEDKYIDLLEKCGYSVGKDDFIGIQE